MRSPSAEDADAQVCNEIALRILGPDRCRIVSMRQEFCRAFWDWLQTNPPEQDIEEEAKIVAYLIGQMRILAK